MKETSENTEICTKWTIISIESEIDTESIKILKAFILYQSSDKNILDLSEWRVLESKRMREF